MVATSSKAMRSRWWSGTSVAMLLRAPHPLIGYDRTFTGGQPTVWRGTLGRAGSCRASVGGPASRICCRITPGPQPCTAESSHTGSRRRLRRRWPIVGVGPRPWGRPRRRTPGHTRRAHRSRQLTRHAHRYSAQRPPRPQLSSSRPPRQGRRSGPLLRAEPLTRRPLTWILAPARNGPI
jgi:hypothetical protein